MTCYDIFLLIILTSCHSICTIPVVITIGVAVTDSTSSLAGVLTDYSYINAPGDDILIARCLTGLGPNGSSNGANGVLGGLYFNGTMIPNSGEQGPCGTNVIQVRPGRLTAGLLNIRQCGTFTISAEGIYTCTMMNSSMMDESVRLGVYFSGRCELLDLYISSLNHLSSPYTAAPMIDTPSSSTVTVIIGSPLTLSCTSRGSPPDTFTWMKDGDQTVLQSTSITAVDHTDTNAVFRADYSIDRFTASDNGTTYTCTVTNPIGSDSATITVIGKLLIWCVSTNTV